MVIAVSVFLFISSFMLLTGVIARHLFVNTVLDEERINYFCIFWMVCVVGGMIATYKLATNQQQRNETACEASCEPYMWKMTDNECYCNSDFGWNLADK